LLHGTCVQCKQKYLLHSAIFELLEIDIDEHFLILNSYYNQTNPFRCGFGTVNLRYILSGFIHIRMAMKVGIVVGLLSLSQPLHYSAWDLLGWDNIGRAKYMIGSIEISLSSTMKVWIAGKVLLDAVMPLKDFCGRNLTGIE
jgi:hypothetical protein